MSAVVGNMAIDGAQRMRGAIGDTRRQRAQGVAAHLGAATGHKASADNFPLTKHALSSKQSLATEGYEIN